MSPRVVKQGPTWERSPSFGTGGSRHYFAKVHIMTLFSQYTGALTFETSFRVGRPPSFGTGGNVSIRAEVCVCVCVCVCVVLCVGSTMEKGRD